MKSLFTLLLSFCITCSRARNIIREEFCSNLQCSDRGASVCGIKEEGPGFRLRLFDNECQLLTHGCSVGENEAYGIVNLEYCIQTFPNANITSNGAILEINATKEIECVEFDCTYPDDADKVCGIKEAESGFRVRLFENKCHLIQYNCINKTNFTITELHICNGVVSDAKPKVNRRKQNSRIPNLFIVDANMFNFNNNINDTIENFFSMTHIFDLPVTEVREHINETTRRMMLKVFGPQVVYKPWIEIPETIKEDYYHRPTLNSCFHKCPMKCPETYAPVCGLPGISSREPSLMFQNHCFMDAAQCKMRWDEDSNATTVISAYIESSFMFCLGDTLNTLFRFLPLVRTLQHMGRLKKKGYFRYKMRNMGFLNNRLIREPNLMGR